jgi:hypothetical protein
MDGYPGRPRNGPERHLTLSAKAEPRLPSGVTGPCGQRSSTTPRPDSDTGREVDRENIIKAYEKSKGEYIPVEPEELEAVAIESKRTIEIDQFVPRKEIEELILQIAITLFRMAKQARRLRARKLKRHRSGVGTT